MLCITKDVTLIIKLEIKYCLKGTCFHSIYKYLTTLHDLCIKCLRGPYLPSLNMPKTMPKFEYFPTYFSMFFSILNNSISNQYIAWFQYTSMFLCKF